jgi:FK506-binding protein 1
MAQKLDKKVLSEGNKTDYPQQGDEVAMNYTGWLYDASATDNQNRGNKFVPPPDFI